MLDGLSTRLRYAPPAESLDRLLSLKDWVPLLRSVPSAFYSRIAFQLPNIHSRIEDLIALEAPSSDESESEQSPIKVRRRSAAVIDPVPLATGHNTEEALLLNDPPVSFEVTCRIMLLTHASFSVTYASKRVGTALGVNRQPTKRDASGVTILRRNVHGPTTGLPIPKGRRKLKERMTTT